MNVTITRNNPRRRTVGRSFFLNFLLYIFGMVFMLLFYQNTLFRALDGTTEKQSSWILWGIVIVSAVVNNILSDTQENNMWTMMFRLLPGFCIYTVIAYLRLAPAMIGWILTIAALLCAAYTVMTLIPTIDHPERRTAILKRRIGRALYGSYCILMLAVCTITVVLRICTTSHSGPFASEVTAVVPSKEHSITIASEMDTLVKLETHTWRNLSVQERLEVLQVAANIEADALGLPHELKVVIGTENKYSINACYNDTEHTISIMLHHLEGSGGRALLRSVCHEARHAYQHRLVSLFNSVDEAYQALALFDNARQFKYEFAHYISDEKDLEGYYTQLCEEDARQYAKTTADAYAEQIIDYLREQHKNDTSEPVSRESDSAA